MRDIIKLTCQSCKRDNYVTDKNKRTMTEKFSIKKYCRACDKHTDHKEGKISRGEASLRPHRLCRAHRRCAANTLEEFATLAIVLTCRAGP